MTESIRILLLDVVRAIRMHNQNGAPDAVAARCDILEKILGNDAIATACDKL